MTARPLAFAVPALLLFGLMTVVEVAHSAPWDNQPKILVHTAPQVGNPCSAGQLSDCRTASVTGGLYPQTYFTYILAAPGNLQDVTGLQFGITYENGAPNGVSDGSQVDIYTWTLCATQELQSSGWPNPESGTLITWSSCQSGETAVAGFFYMAAYSDDILRIIPHPLDNQARVANCASSEVTLSPGDLGFVAYSSGQTEPGSNPCGSGSQPTMYTLTASAGPNGTIEPVGVNSVPEGGDQGYTITPSQDYSVSDVIVDGVSVGAVTSYTFTSVSTDHTIIASFRLCEEFTIMASTPSGGTILPRTGVTTILCPGGDQQFLLRAPAGYHIRDVLVDGISVGRISSYTFTNIQANHTIEVTGFDVTAPGFAFAPFASVPMPIPEVWMGDVAVGDFNRDGTPDIAAAINNNGTSCVSVVLGAGCGNFSPPAIFNAGTTCMMNQADELQAADVNNDGILDLVMTQTMGCAEFGTFTVQLGDGAGGFASPGIVFEIGDGSGIPGYGGISGHFVVADFNEDGNLDIFVDSPYSYTTYLHFGYGDGTFTFGTSFPLRCYLVEPECTGQPFPFSTYNPFIALDLDGDGHVDVARGFDANNSVGRFGLLKTVVVAFGTGTGDWRSMDFLDNGSPPRMGGNRVASGDFDENGIVDLVVTGGGFFDHHLAGYHVLLGTGGGAFAAAISSPGAVGFSRPVVADFDLDGHLDVASHSGTERLVYVTFGNGDGTFYDTQAYVVGDPGSESPETLQAADLNGDGRMDLVAGTVPGYMGDPGRISVLLNQTAITSQPQDVSLCPGATANLSVTAPGSGGYAHQWRKAGVDLIDGTTAGGSVLSGSTGPALTITNLAAADAGQYDCRISNGCQELISNAATVTVGCSAPTPPGSLVQVALGGGVLLTYDAVTAAGSSSVSVGTSGPAPPEGANFIPAGSPSYYELVTSASFTGEIDVCLGYDPLQLSGSVVNLKLFHWDTALPTPAWVDITDSVDSMNHLVCGKTNHLSPFVLMEVPAVAEFVDVSGTVSACNGPLEGVTVDLLDAVNDFHTTTTNALGAYLFENIPHSAVVDAAEASISIPLGYEALSPDVAGAALTLDQDRVVNFTLTCLQPTGPPRSMGYWKHNANVFLSGRGAAQESQVNMTTGYPQAIFNHFHENGLNGISVSGVTYKGNPAGPIDLATISATLTVNKGGTALDRARQQYLPYLLNIASGKLSTSTVVTADGGTSSQVLQYVADLINDGIASNDDLARDLSETINDAQLVAAGRVPLDQYGDIAYARRRFADLPLQVSPNPSGPEPSVFSFVMPLAGEVQLEIFDISGHRVATPLAGFMAAGPQQAVWTGVSGNGRPAAQGMYYGRITTPLGMKTVRFLRLDR